MMRILHVSHRNFVAGGSDAVFMAATKLLRDDGHDVVPFCTTDRQNEPSKYDRYFPKGANTGSPKWREAIRYAWNKDARHLLDQLIVDHGPFDIAHLHIYHGKQTPAILPILARHGIPTIQSLHEYKLACPVYTLQRGNAPCVRCVDGSSLNALRYRCKSGSMAKSLAMWAEFHTGRLLGDVRLIDRFICVSEFQRQIMIRAGLPAQKLHVLHNFVDIQTKPYKAPRNGEYLFYAGRIETLKGIKTLIEAAKLAGKRLLIAGTGSWEEDLRREIANVPQITYLGFQDQAKVMALIKDARAIVVPSEWYENCPMAVLEAKAMGKPVIASDIGGISELVRDGIDGYLFKPGNVEELRDLFEKIWESDCETLGQSGQHDACNRFSKETYLPALLAHYGAIARPHKITQRNTSAAMA